MSQPSIAEQAADWREGNSRVAADLYWKAFGAQEKADKRQQELLDFIDEYDIDPAIYFDLTMGKDKAIPED